MTAMVSPNKIAQIMGLRHKVSSLRELSAAVNEGLPKSALSTSVARVFPAGPERTAMLYRIIPEATYKRRGTHLKAEESARTERLARVIATAEHVWDDRVDAHRFLRTEHAQLESRRPIDVALTELGARRVEELLWQLYYGVVA